MSSAEQCVAPTRYFDRYFQSEAVKILPGEFYATSQGNLIVTVLGSCVAVCLRDPISQVGGMNHFLLPSDESSHERGYLSDSARYGTYAMEVLINQLLKLGASRYRLEAKVFGGGNVLQGMLVNNIGQRNAEFVLEFLRQEKIPILAKDLLDIYPRKVFFFADTGQVLVKKIKELHNTTILDRESEYRMRIKQLPKGGNVDLF